MSDLIKLKRLVDGDDRFAWRVEAACWLAELDFTRAVLTFVATDDAVQQATTVDEDLTVDSTAVPDAAIEAAVTAYKTAHP